MQRRSLKEYSDVSKIFFATFNMLQNENCFENVKMEIDCKNAKSI